MGRLEERRLVAGGWRPAAGLVAAVLAGPLAFAADAAKVTYDDHVLPILREKCFGCHNPDKARGGLTLTSYAKVMEGGGSGAAVESGDPEASRLYLLVAHRQQPHMPPKADKLPADSLEVFRAWIAGGALENAGSKPRPAKPRAEIALAVTPLKKPDGPPPMPAALSIEPAVRAARPNTLTALASSPWAPLFAVAGEKQALLYHAETLDLLGVLPFPEGIPHVLRFSRNGSLLLAAGGHAAKSGRAVVWNVATGERAVEVGDAETDAILAADLSADQTRIAVGGPSKLVRIYATEDGRVLAELKKHTDWIRAIEFSPDGVLLATGDRGGGLFVWEAGTAREFHNLRGHAGGVAGVSWRADSNVLASVGADTRIRLWEMENGSQVTRWGAHGDGAESVAFTSDGRLTSAGRDRVVKVWDQNGTLLRQMEPFSDIALRAVFSHDGTRVAGGDWNGEVRVWLAADGKLLGTLAQNPLPIAERLAAARKEAEGLAPAHAQAAAAEAASRAAAEKAAGELAAARQAASEGPARAAAAAERAERAREAAFRGRGVLEGALLDLAAKEVLVRGAAGEAGKGDAFAKAKADLEGAQQTATALAAAVESALAEWVSSRREGERAAAEAAAAASSLGGLEPAAKATAEKAAADKAALDSVAPRLAVAQALVAKWTVEEGIDLARKEFAARSAEHARLAAAAAAEESEAARLAAEMEALAKSAAGAAAAAQAAAEGLTAAREGADRSVATLAAALSDLAAREAAAKGKEPADLAVQDLEAARKTAEGLGAALKSAIAAWVTAQQGFAQAHSDAGAAAERAAALEPALKAAREKSAAAKEAADRGAGPVAESRESLAKAAAARR
jgi:hypothetical protein